MAERKQDVVNEIRDLQNLPQLILSRGSSVPHEFFLDIARELSLPILGTMPQYAKAIIENSGMSWDPSFSSEGTRSGGGSTVTYEGLCAIRDAYVMWQSQDEDDFRIKWSPPDNWHELRQTVVERESVHALVRPNAPEFRMKVLSEYGGKCAISGCNLQNVVEAAHVIPYFGPTSDVIQNGIPLRVDLHRAFDAGLFDLDINEVGEMFVSWVEETMLQNYGEILGKQLIKPQDSNNGVSIFALIKRREFLNLHENRN